MIAYLSHKLRLQEDASRAKSEASTMAAEASRSEDDAVKLNELEAEVARLKEKALS